MKFKLNNIIPSGFRQYNAKSHEQGGQPVSEDGTPNNKGKNSVELKESAYTYKNMDTNKTYIFSDKLKTSPLLKNIMKKYSKKKHNMADLDEPTLNAMEQEIKSVENYNENIKGAISSMMEKRYGGAMKKEMADGGVLEPLPQSNPVNINTAFSFNPGTNMHDRTQWGSNAKMESDFRASPLSPTNSPDAKNSFDIMNGVERTESDSKGLLDVSSVLRTAGLVGGAMGLFKGTDKEKPIHTDYGEAQNQMNQLDASLDQSRQDAVASSNLYSNLNKNSSGSFNQFRSREIANIGALQDNLGNIAQQEQGMRNNIALQRGQFEAGKAQDFSNEQRRIVDNNQRNMASADTYKNSILGDIVHEGDRLSTIKNQANLVTAQNKEVVALLNNLYSDFEIDESFVQATRDLAAGKITEEEFNKIKDSKAPVKIKE